MFLIIKKHTDLKILSEYSVTELEELEIDFDVNAF